ncbi:glycosyltransferase [Methylobacterium ajmalii]|uniref:Glycosyltransferase n=1 Tax=Methylobacterium ajmalii TaxID=2738439 RepID=A0ABV0A3G4_9HYPH
MQQGSVDSIALEEVVDTNYTYQSSKNYNNEKIYFDISDLLQYWRNNRLPTGIQRVQISLIENILGNERFCIVAICYPYSFWKIINKTYICMLVEKIRNNHAAGDVDWDRIICKIDKELEIADYVQFSSNSCLLSVGCTWWIPNFTAAVNEARYKFKIIYASFVHDLIPILARNFCQSQLIHEFTQWIYTTLEQSDIIFANSENTAKDLVEVAKSVHDYESSPVVCKLNAKPLLQQTKEISTISKNIKDYTLGPFVIYVSTIERRKDHLLVFSAWIDLCKRYGDDSVPNLICVGKVASENDEAMQFYNSNPKLAQKVRIISDASDSDLHFLYNHCLFSIYASRYEGWGLPVTESLYYNKIPLIANNTSLIEAGEQFAAYFETGNKNSFIDAITHLIFNSDYRRRLENKAKSVQPRNWSDIAKFIISIIEEFVPKEENRRFVHKISPGVLYNFSLNNSIDIKHDNLRASLFRSGGAWHKAEEWGVWTSDTKASISFISPIFGADTLIYLQLKSPSHNVNTHIKINGSFCHKLNFNDCSNYCFKLPKESIERSGTVLIEIINLYIQDLSENQGSDTRCIGIGISNIMVCSADDVMSRLSYIERFGKINIYM